SASAIGRSSQGGHGRPAVVEVLDGLRAGVEQRGARRDRGPRRRERLVLTPLVFEVFAWLAVEDAGRRCDDRPVAEIGLVVPARPAVLDCAAAKRARDELRWRQLVEV